jgi:tRNA1Val (adenine37-N6)-methyltransferase
MDVLLDGRVKIVQRRDGYRVNEDSIRLCRFVRSLPEAAGIDLGAGCGLVAIVLALEKKVKSMVALELQESLATLARRNVVLNGLGGHHELGRTANREPVCRVEVDDVARSGPEALIEVVQGDIRMVEKMFQPHSFALAVSNPPYREVGRGRLSPSAEKIIARHEKTCSLEDLVRAAAYLLKPQGIFTFCQLVERWETIAETLADNGFVVSRRDDVGEVALVEAVAT